MVGRYAARIGVALLALVVVAATPSAAGAHAALQSSSPPDGAVLPAPPAEVSLRFTEGVTPDLSVAALYDVDGELVPAALTLTADTLALRPDSALPVGAYVVTWTVLSREDGHVTRGTVTFAVGEAALPTAPSSISGGAGVAETGFRFARLLGLAASFGLAAAPVLAGADDVARRRARRRARVPAAVAGIASIAVVISLAAAVSGWDASLPSAAWRVVAGTGPGRATLIIVAACALVVAWGASSRAEGPVLAAGVAVVAALAYGGHPSSGPGVPGAWVLLQTVHAGAALLWAGTVAWLVLGKEPLDGASARRVAGRVPAVALLAAGTGFLLVAASVRTVDGALYSGYGLTLILKVILVTVVAGLGWFAGRALRAGERRVRHLALEGLVFVTVLGATGALAALAPPRGPEWLPPAATSLVTTVDDLQVGLEVSPGRAGENVVEVVTGTARRPAPAVTSIDVAIGQGDAGTAVAAIPAGPDRWRLGTAAFTDAGRWRVGVTASRDDGSRGEATFDVEISPPGSTAPAREVRTSRLPLAVLAVPAGVALLAAAAVAASRARRRESAQTDPVTPVPASPLPRR